MPRRRDDDEEEYEDDAYEVVEEDDGEDEPPPFPATVLTAGIIWILYGGLSIVNAVVSLSMGGANANAPPNPGGGVGSSLCPALIGIAFLVCGFQTVKGTASSTRGNSVGSLLLGFLGTLGGLLIAFGSFALPGGNNQAGDKALLLIVGFVVIGVGMLLLLAGILGLVGMQKYLEWRRYYKPSKKNRKKS